MGNVLNEPAAEQIGPERREVYFASNVIRSRCLVARRPVNSNVGRQTHIERLADHERVLHRHGRPLRVG